MQPISKENSIFDRAGRVQENREKMMNAVDISAVYTLCVDRQLSIDLGRVFILNISLGFQSKIG